MTQLSPTALEEAAKAISISTGDEPSKLTYAHEMQCTGRDREPKYRWQYWTEHATAAITAYLAQREKEGFVEVPKEASEEVVNAALDKHAEITPCESLRTLHPPRPCPGGRGAVCGPRGDRLDRLLSFRTRP